MVLELSKSFVHSPCGLEESKYSEKEVKDIMLKLIEKNGISPSDFNITKDGKIQLNELPNLRLHTIMLQAEEMGLSIKFTKKTLIEVC